MNGHFSTRDFVATHGHTPRGRGGWIFQSADRVLVVEEDGKFTAARARVARQHPWVRHWIVCP